MIILRNLAFYISAVLGSIVLTIAALLAGVFSPRHVRPICDFWSRVHHWECANLLGITVKVEGSQPDTQAFYAVKHEAMFEAIAVPMLFDFPALFGKKELFVIPGWGRVARAYGVIPVSRDEGAKALRTMIREVRPYIDAGRPLVIFPEGTRVPHGESPPLGAGFAALYKMVRLPVVPVAVNSGPVYHHFLKRKGTITIRYGEPIPPGLPRAEVEARVHAAINSLNGNAELEDMPQANLA